MAKIFNGNMWNGIGNTISNQYALKDAQRYQAMKDAGNTALSMEKMLANNKMKQDWMDYIKGIDERQQAEEAAQTDANVEEMEADQAEEDREEAAATDYIDTVLGNEQKMEDDMQAAQDAQVAAQMSDGGWVNGVQSTNLMSPLEYLRLQMHVGDDWDKEKDMYNIWRSSYVKPSGLN